MVEEDNSQVPWDHQIVVVPRIGTVVAVAKKLLQGVEVIHQRIPQHPSQALHSCPSECGYLDHTRKAPLAYLEAHACCYACPFPYQEVLQSQRALALVLEAAWGTGEVLEVQTLVALGEGSRSGLRVSWAFSYH